MFYRMLENKSMNLILELEQNSNQGQLWLGNQKAAKNFTDLKEKKIKFIVTIADGFKIEFPEDLEIQHKVFPVVDNEHFKISKIFNQTNDYILKSLQEGNVLVHCFAGISRSSTIVIAFLMFFKKWDFEKAFKFTKSKRQLTNPNEGFRQQLINYGQELNNIKMIETKENLNDYEISNPVNNSQKKNRDQKFFSNNKEQRIVENIGQNNEMKQQYENEVLIDKKLITKPDTLNQLQNLEISIEVEEYQKTKKKDQKYENNSESLDDQITRKGKSSHFYQSEKLNKQSNIPQKSTQNCSSKQFQFQNEGKELNQTKNFNKSNPQLLVISPRSQVKITRESSAEVKKQFLLDFARKMNYAYLQQANLEQKLSPKSEKFQNQIQFDSTKHPFFESQRKKEIEIKNLKEDNNKQQMINKISSLSTHQQEISKNDGLQSNFKNNSLNKSRSNQKVGLNLFKLNQNCS